MKVLFLFGEICSGKSTYKPSGWSTRITVSDIVKRLMQSGDREILQNTKHLDTVIAEELAIEIWHYSTFAFENEQSTPDYIVIDGIRQLSIVTQLESLLQRSYPDWTIEYKWLDVDREERKRRFEARKDPKDTMTFEQAEEREP